MKNIRPVTIAGIRFPSMRAAIEHARSILYGRGAGTAISGQEEEFVAALLRARPDKLREIGHRKIVRYFRGTEPNSLGPTVCFYAEFDDGERIDFSFMKAIANIAAAQPAAFV